MNGWRSLILRIGDKSPEYGTSSDFKDHIVRFLLLSFAFSAQLILQFDYLILLTRFFHNFSGNLFWCPSSWARQLSNWDFGGKYSISDAYCCFNNSNVFNLPLLFISVSQFLTASNKRFLDNWFCHLLTTSFDLCFISVSQFLTRIDSEWIDSC